MAYTKETDNIARLLSKDCVSKDKAIFMAWRDGKIDTSACIRAFRQNNHVSDLVQIDRHAFVMWLKEEGY